MTRGLYDVATVSDWWVNNIARYPVAHYVETYKSGIVTKPVELRQDTLDQSVQPAYATNRDVSHHWDSNGGVNLIDSSQVKLIRDDIYQNPESAVAAAGTATDRAAALALLQK